MEITTKSSKFWNYLPKDIKHLLEDGLELIEILKDCPHERLSDYSYLVYPFAKAYEGFMKKVFLDLHVITEDDYYGEDVRVGKLLNPFFNHRSSAYRKIAKRTHKDVSERLWRIWRRGRNQVFHYFPNNYKKLSKEEALEIVQEFVACMEFAVEKFGL